MKKMMWVFWVVWLFSFEAWAQSALTVEVVLPKQEVVEKAHEASGFVRAKALASVDARLNGAVLTDIAVEVGDVVEKGAVLMRFDAAMIEQELAQAKAQLAQAEVALRLGGRNAKRAQELLAERAMSAMEAEQLVASRDEAKARVAQAKALVELQKLRLEYAEVVAPVAGVVSEKLAVLGQTATVGMPLLQMMVDGALQWQAEVPSEWLSEVEVGTAVRLKFDEMEVSGVVENIAPVVDERSRRGLVYVDLQETAGLRAGLLLRGEFLVDSYEALTVPSSAVTIEDGYHYVWVVDDSSRVHRQNVEVGRRDNQRVEVRGVEAQARLVMRGGSFLVDGDLVHVVNQSPTLAR